MSKRGHISGAAFVLLALCACRDFDQDFEAWCLNENCGAVTPDAGQLIIAPETSPVRLVAGQCGIVNLRVRYENGDPPAERPQAEITFPALEGRPQPSINRTNTCEEQISSVVIDEGRVTVPIFILDKLAGSYEQPLSVYFPDSDRTVSGTLPIEVSPASPVRVAFTASPEDGRIGVCNGPFEASFFDAFGNRAFAASAVPLELTTNSPTGAFHGEATCAAPLMDAGAAVGAGGLTFFYSDTQLGSRQIRVSSSALDGGSGLAVLPLRTAPPSRVLITGAPRDALEDTCSSAFILEFADPFGHLVPVEAPTTLMLTANTARFFGDSNCGVQISSPTVDAGTAFYEFYVNAAAERASETITVSTNPAMTPATHEMTITSAGAPRLSLNAVSPTPFAAGACNRLSVVATRVDGGPATVDASVELSGPAQTDGGFFRWTDTNCLGPAITQEGFDAGTNVLFVNYRDQVAGTRQLIASAPLHVSGRLTVEVGAGPVSRLDVIDAPPIVESGVCTPVRVRAVDQLGNETPRTNGIRVTGATTLKSERISAAPGCAVNGVATFGPDAGVTTLYWSAEDNGTTRFTVSAADGGAASTSFVADVVPGPPVIAALGPGGGIQGSPGCGQTQYYIELRDRFAVPTTARVPIGVSVTATPVQTAATCQATFFYEGSSCGVERNVFTIPDGGSRANFKLGTKSASSCTYTLKSGGLAPTTMDVRMCRFIGAPCANNGDCCSGSCGPLALKCK